MALFGPMPRTSHRASSEASITAGRVLKWAMTRLAVGLQSLRGTPRVSSSSMTS